MSDKANSIRQETSHISELLYDPKVQEAMKYLGFEECDLFPVNELDEIDQKDSVPLEYRHHMHLYTQVAEKFYETKRKERLAQLMEVVEKRANTNNNTINEENGGSRVINTPNHRRIVSQQGLRPLNLGYSINSQRLSQQNIQIPSLRGSDLFQQIYNMSEQNERLLQTPYTDRLYTPSAINLFNRDGILYTRGSSRGNKDEMITKVISRKTEIDFADISKYQNKLDTKSLRLKSFLDKKTLDFDNKISETERRLDKAAQNLETHNQKLYQRQQDKQYRKMVEGQKTQERLQQNEKERQGKVQEINRNYENTMKNYGRIMKDSSEGMQLFQQHLMKEIASKLRKKEQHHDELRMKLMLDHLKRKEVKENLRRQENQMKYLSEMKLQRLSLSSRNGIQITQPLLTEASPSQLRLVTPSNALDFLDDRAQSPILRPGTTQNGRRLNLKLPQNNLTPITTTAETTKSKKTEIPPEINFLQHLVECFDKNVDEKLAAKALVFDTRKIERMTLKGSIRELKLPVYLEHI